jgi:Dinitrogenase iron-molybdenum cofactor.
MEQNTQQDMGSSAPESTTVIAVNVDGDQVGGGWGRAHTVALATIARGTIVSWEEIEVGWDVSHDTASSEGSHHADIVRFLRDHEVRAVVTGHMGPPMAQTLRKLHVFPLVNAAGDARDAALAGAAFVAEHEGGTEEPTTVS